MMKSLCIVMTLFLLSAISMISCDNDDSSENSIRTSFGGITLLDHSISSCLDNPQLPCTVSGSARNDAGFTFSMVTVKVSFLNENGEIISTGIDSFENLKRGREFNFVVEPPQKDFQTDKYDIEIITKH